LTRTYRYLGRIFKQREDGPETVQFLAPAEDVEDWGGVPQKSSKFMKGFQRAEIRPHLNAISEFFEGKRNISPTAVVVAFKPDKVRIKRITANYDIEIGDVEEIGGPVLLEVDYDDLSEKSISELAGLVFTELGGDKYRDQLLSDDSVLQPSNSEDDEGFTQNEPGEDLGGGNDELNEGIIDDEVVEDTEISVHESQLNDFLRFLLNRDALKEVENEDPDKLRSMLSNLLKPATIVDGQHRTKGAANLERKIPFTVVGLVNTEWAEQVFQFVIINQKAKPIDTAFLTAIISASLSPSDIDALKERLENAKVDLANSTIINLVNFSPASPFKGLIDLKVQEATGSLGYAGMLTLANRFRTLRTHEPNRIKFKHFFESVFASHTPGGNYLERSATWRENEWFKYFVGFWDEVENQYTDLWEPGTNLFKIVTLQELQNLFLSWLFDRSEAVEGIGDFRNKVTIFLGNLKSNFFEKEWKLTSLQSDNGRNFLRLAIQNARSIPNYRYGDKLFRGVH